MTRWARVAVVGILAGAVTWISGCGGSGGSGLSGLNSGGPGGVNNGSGSIVLRIPYRQNRGMRPLISNEAVSATVHVLKGTTLVTTATINDVQNEQTVTINDIAPGQTVIDAITLNSGNGIQDHEAVTIDVQAGVNQVALNLGLAEGQLFVADPGGGASLVARRDQARSQTGTVNANIQLFNNLQAASIQIDSSRLPSVAVATQPLTGKVTAVSNSQSDVPIPLFDITVNPAINATADAATDLADNRLYVLDRGLGQVIRFTNVAGGAPQQDLVFNDATLIGANSMVVDTAGDRIYIADAADEQILVVNADTMQLVASLVNGVFVSDGPLTPAIDAGLDKLYACRNGSIVRFDNASQLNIIGQVATGTVFDINGVAETSITVDEADTLYASNLALNQIFKLTGASAAIGIVAPSDQFNINGVDQAARLSIDPVH